MNCPHYCTSLCFDARKTSVNPSSSTILIGLQLFAIHLATVLVNLSQVDLLRGLRCSVRVVWRIPLLADQRMHRVELVLSPECAYHFGFIECSIFVFFKHELSITAATNEDWAELCVYWKLILRMRSMR